MNKQSVWHGVIFFAILAAAAAVRYPLVFLSHPFYNSDTAILDLMARHFLHGEGAFYYWGEHYYGVLDPVLLMPLFKLFGQTPAVSGVLPFTAALVFLSLFHRYVRQDYGMWVAHGSTLLLAIPSTIFLRYTITTYNYAFGPCLAILLLLLARDLKNTGNLKGWFRFGLCLGFSYYYFRFVMIFFLGLLIHEWVVQRSADDVQWLQQHTQKLSLKIFWERWVLLKGFTVHPLIRVVAVVLNVVGVTLVCFCVPLWFHGNVEHPIAGTVLKISFWYTLDFAVQLLLISVAMTYWRLWLNLLKQALRQPHYRQGVKGFIIGFLPGILGCLFLDFPGSAGKIVSLPVCALNLRIFGHLLLPAMQDAAPFPLWTWVCYALLLSGLAYVAIRPVFFVLDHIHRQKNDALSILIIVGFLNLAVGIAGMHLGDVPCVRYFLAFLIGLAVAQTLCLVRVARFSRVLAIGLFSLYVGNNVLANASLIRSSHGSERFTPIFQHLLERGYHAGYADYWIAYRMTALSQERLIVAPTGDNDRYPPYLKFARAQSESFLLSNTPVAPLDARVIKGVPYDLRGQEVVNGMFIYYLHKHA